MALRSLPYLENQRVYLSAREDLHVSGWDQAIIYIDSDELDSVRVNQNDTQVVIDAREDLEVRLPRNAQVIITSVRGNARVEALTSELNFDRVRGNLILVRTDAVKGSRVDGNVDADEVSGDLKVDRIGGNVNTRNCPGNLTLEKVGGNIVMREPKGNLVVRAGGNIRASYSELTAQTINMAAGGNIDLGLPSSPNLQLTVLAAALRIASSFQAQTTSRMGGSAVLKLGDGTAQAQLRAGGKVRLSNTVSDDGDFRDIDLEDDFDEDFDDDDDDDEDDDDETIISRGPNHRITVKLDNISKAVDLKVRKATEKLDREFGRSNSWMEDAFVTPAPPVPPVPPQPPRPSQASPEERMLILNMLAEKKITPEEASRLLEIIEHRQE